MTTVHDMPHSLARDARIRQSRQAGKLFTRLTAAEAKFHERQIKQRQMHAALIRCTPRVTNEGSLDDASYAGSKCRRGLEVDKGGTQAASGRHYKHV